MRIARPVSEIIESLQSLPGIGPRSAERLAYHLLRMPENEVFQMADKLRDLRKNTTTCQSCFNIAESEMCEVCSDTQRSRNLFLVAEEPLDVIALERTGRFNGMYHVLGGVMDPIRGIGPDELRVQELRTRIGDALLNGEVEIILAMNPSTEGETTAIYLKRYLEENFINHPLRITRIARGLPVGGDLEYADPMTLSRSLEGRVVY